MLYLIFRKALSGSAHLLSFYQLSSLVVIHRLNLLMVQLDRLGSEHRCEHYLKRRLCVKLYSPYYLH